MSPATDLDLRHSAVDPLYQSTLAGSIRFKRHLDDTSICVGNPSGGSIVSKRTKRRVCRPWSYRAAPQRELTAATHKRPTEGRTSSGSSVRVFGFFASRREYICIKWTGGPPHAAFHRGNVPPLQGFAWCISNRTITATAAFISLF